MIVGKTATGQSSTSLKVLRKLVEAAGGREKIPTLKIGNVKCGRVPSVSSAVNVARVQSSSSALPPPKAYSSWIHSRMMGAVVG